MSGRKRVTSLALPIAILAALAGPATLVQAAAAKWTIMVYMSGDNNLEDYIVKDLELELAALGSTASVQITALADRGPGYDKSRGDWQIDQALPPDPGHARRRRQRRRRLGRAQPGRPRHPRRLRRVVEDELPGRPLRPVLLGPRLGLAPRLDDGGRHARQRRPRPATRSSRSWAGSGFIDVVGYDACNMAQIEIMDLWNGHATALVGSQEFVNMDGIEYDTVISQLRANPNMTADQVAAASSASATVEKTYSSMAVDNRYAALRTAVDAWAIALKAAVPAQKATIARGFTNAKSFWQAPTDKDLYDLAKQINAQVTGTDLKNKGTAVMNAVDAVVLHKRFTGKAYNMVHGITITGITRPVEKTADWTYYHSLDFAQRTNWDEFEDLLAS